MLTKCFYMKLNIVLKRLRTTLVAKMYEEIVSIYVIRTKSDVTP